MTEKYKKTNIIGAARNAVHADIPREDKSYGSVSIRKTLVDRLNKALYIQKMEDPEKPTFSDLLEKVINWKLVDELSKPAAGK